MSISDKLSVQEILQYCKLNGIKNIVISPGSRNAPLTISFTQDNFFNCYSIVDERSAAFIAMGMAQQLNHPVAIICTSGSAALNYAPAVVESFYQNIPLLVITADRPTNGLNRGDGQCFKQEYIYQNYIKFQCSIEENRSNKLVKKGFEQLLSYPFGPVHINIHFEEPLYNLVNAERVEASKLAIEPLQNISKNDIDKLSNELSKFEKILVVIAQGNFGYLADDLYSWMERDARVYIISENTSNLKDERINASIDRTLAVIQSQETENFIPECIITLGTNIISKRIKKWLRIEKVQEHWSFDTAHHYDYFNCLKYQFDIGFELLLQEISKGKNTKGTYQTFWSGASINSLAQHREFLNKVSFCDLKAIEIILKELPNVNLHLSNSSVVRYAQLFDVRSDFNYLSNRGVSGIDGCTSTALGYAHQNKSKNVLITGDISFLYDSNALWNNIDADLLIIVINNGEGNIFKIIDGPQEVEQSLPYFTTPHNISIEKLCDLYSTEHIKVENERELQAYLSNCIIEGVKVLEVDTSKVDNDKILKEYFNSLKSLP